MKLKFKKQAYQTRAVDAVVNCFKGQPDTSGIKYRIDPGYSKKKSPQLESTGFKNDDIALNGDQLLANIQEVQRLQNIPQSDSLVKTQSSSLNLDIEMETGTGKTYCYIKTIFEMNKRYGWTKFVIVVPSIAIREGVHKSLEITADHFLESYGKKIKFFTYNSKQLHNIESYSSDSGINVMVINIQAFASRGKDNRRIYEELDDFQSRKPIDVIKANKPILILDEPQKMEGQRTQDSLKEFAPLFVLRYSATHRTQHNKVHRLDALDAYNQKLVKKIAVRGISVKGLPGTNGYLYLESIEVSRQAPVARIEFETKEASGAIKPKIKKLGKGANLYDLSGGLDEYKNYVISDINAITDTVEFTNGEKLMAGEVANDENEMTLRRIQIREAIKAHFEKEQRLFQQGIKVLTLFFIDEVAKYRLYTESGEKRGEYAMIFEEEYETALAELKRDLLISAEYRKHLDSIPTSRTHNGYFSIDKKGRMVDALSTTQSERIESTDQSAYDLILKAKEQLLSFEEPTRFIFSHSALREGWDNPNVFVICTLKHSDNTISRRQEVGRGLRIAVNQLGDRQDDPATVHQTNVLTVVANESYKDFVTALQKDISASLSERPRVADVKYFTGKVLQTPTGPVTVTKDMAEEIEFYLIQNGYIDRKRNVLPT
jgi:type III restriction enzyme